MEVNERIIEEYIKTIKRWFYMTDISFAVPHNYSNIDLLAYDQKEDKYYDFEIKYRSAKKIEAREFEDHINQMLRSERIKKIKEIIGENKKPKKIFVTTRVYFGKSNTKEKKMIDEFLKKGYEADVWYFDEIIPELYKTLDEKGRYNTELTQTIRLIKTYIKKE